ncbi:MAG: PrgI family protein [Clostridia bacterium]|nr:PrgI family protein [Clostridia bacterium]
MAYVTIPKDLSQVKTKFLFNLTKRQVICFGCGILVGLPLFFILRGVMPASAAALIMIVVMMPFFLFAMYERNGEPLEKVLRHIYDAKFKRSKQRPYKTNNFYTVLTRQAKLDKEVRAIVQGR